MRAYVVTEGESDAEFVRRVLKIANLEDVYVAPAGGRSSAMSLAKSILLERDRPVALVLDAETSDPIRAREEAQIVTDLISADSSMAPFHLFLAVPEMEAIVFSDLPTVSRLLGKHLLQRKPPEADARPREALQRLLGHRHRPGELTRFFASVDDEAAQTFAQHEPLRSLISFLRESGSKTNSHTGRN